MNAGTNSERNAEAIRKRICEAFASVENPPRWHLSDSDEGDEPGLIAREFFDKSDWRTLDADFLDRAPDGYASALSFFSDEAFRFYLPAYLLADLDGALHNVDVVFHLCHGLEDRSRMERINPRRYGERTWLDAARHRFAIFDARQARAIVDFLRFKLEAAEPHDRPRIEQALQAYWLDRAQ